MVRLRSPMNCWRTHTVICNDLPTTGLRFFTVYGPWGRPDMALSLFANAICNGETIKLFNHGNMIRSFTYVDDVVESMVRLIENARPNKF